MAEPQLTNVQQLQVQKAVDKAKEDLEKNYINYDKLTQLTGMQKEMIRILHQSVAKNTTISELAYFLTYCKGVGLNPLNKEIWCYKNKDGDVIIFTGRDGFLKKNKENPLYRGMRSSEVCELDEFEIDMIEGTVIHKITNNRGKPIGAYAIVFVEGMKDVVTYVDFDEFNLGQAKWKSAPKMMIKKCAQSLALKEAAGLTGIQAEEAFVVKDGIASSTGEEQKSREQITNGKEEERLLMMIECAKDAKQLNDLKDECKTPRVWEAYQKKMDSFDLS